MSLAHRGALTAQGQCRTTQPVTDGPQVLRRQVDLSGLLEVLGKNLYSTPTVALRELVQNGHDSCVRRRIEDPEGAADPSITVWADAAAGRLFVEDTGAGLTRDEIEHDLATVGRGYTRRLRAEHADAELIGQFGLGFLTAFIIGQKVDLYTTSFQTPDEGWHFSSTGGERYVVTPAPARAVGTRVEITLAPAFRELADQEVLHRVLQSYCALLRVPVYTDAARARRANDVPPPWRSEEVPSPLRRRRLGLEFASRFEPTFRPLCTFDLKTRSGAPSRGLVWIQDGGTYGTSDNRNVSVFVRGMLVSRRAFELLPKWAGFVGAVVESDLLEPTASREDLRQDGAYEALAADLRGTLIDGLAELSSGEPALWRSVVARHNEALLGAALSDPRLFDLLKDELRVPTTEGDLVMKEILRRSAGKVHVSLGERGSAEETLFRALKVPVVLGFRFAAMPFAERVAEARGASFVRLGTESGNRSLFPPAELDRGVHDALAPLLLEPGWALVPSRFKPAALPAVLIPDRDVELKARLESDEADRRIGAAALGLARRFTHSVDDTVRARLFLNLDNPAVARTLAAEGPRREAAARLLKALALMMSQDPASASRIADGLSDASDAILALLGEG